MIETIPHDRAMLPSDRHGPARRHKRVVTKDTAFRSAANKLMRHVALKGVADLRKLVADNQQNLELLREHRPQLHAAILRTIEQIEQSLRNHAV